jgi:hypothetical protein
MVYLYVPPRAPLRAATASACEAPPAMNPATTPEALDTDDCTALFAADESVGKAAGGIVRVDTPPPEIESAVTRGRAAVCEAGAITPVRDTVLTPFAVASPPGVEAVSSRPC